MKSKLISLAVLFILASSCDGYRQRQTNSLATSIEDYYTVIKIDDCEYIIYQGNSSKMGLTHKGNCTNHKTTNQ